MAASCLVLAHQPTAAWQAAVWAAAGPEFWRVEHAAAIAAAAGTWPHAWPATPEDSHMSVVLSSSMVPNMLTSHCGLLLATTPVKPVAECIAHSFQIASTFPTLLLN